MIYGRVYVITNLVNGRRYVGITIKTLRARWEQHLGWSRRGKPRLHLHRAISKYGEGQFRVEDLEECGDRTSLNAAEMWWISHLGTMSPRGYNLTAGGEGGSGSKKSAETRAKIAAGNRGKRISAEQIAKMLKSREGFRQPLSARRAISRPILVDGVQYFSIGEAAEALQVTPSCIQRRLKRGEPGYLSLVDERPRRKRTEEQVQAMRDRVSIPVLAGGIVYPSITEAASALGMTRPGVAYRIKVGREGYGLA